MSARIEYAPGEAWCIAVGRALLVCERDLTLARARALHAGAASIDSAEALRGLLDSEPTALIGLIDLAGRRVVLRRHGVPATADSAPMPDRFGPEWSLDEVAVDAAVAAGGLEALAQGTLPFTGGVVRVAAVTVEPRRADASEAQPVEAPVAEGDGGHARSGAFGQTQPPRAAAEERPEAPGAAPAPAPEPPRPAPPAEAAGGAVAPETRPDAPAARTGAIVGLIDSVPGFIKPAVDLDGLPPGDGPQTRPVPAASPAHPGASAPRGAAPPAAGGDHDGMTITVDQARALQAEQPAASGPLAPAQTAGGPATGPLVLSTLCEHGHVNPPGSTECVRCRARVDERSAAQRRRPEVAVAVLPSGERIPLGRGVVIGRRPRSRRVEDGRVPRLVTVESPGEDISRSHLELRVDDWSVVAVDLSSTNGTLLLREGSAPQRLRPETPTILQLGDRLDVGDGVVVAIASVDDGASGSGGAP